MNKKIKKIYKFLSLSFFGTLTLFSTVSFSPKIKSEKVIKKEGKNENNYRKLNSTKYSNQDFLDFTMENFTNIYLSEDNSYFYFEEKRKSKSNRRYFLEINDEKGTVNFLVEIDKNNFKKGFLKFNWIKSEGDYKIEYEKNIFYFSDLIEKILSNKKGQFLDGLLDFLGGVFYGIGGRAAIGAISNITAQSALKAALVAGAGAATLSSIPAIVDFAGESGIGFFSAHNSYLNPAAKESEKESKSLEELLKGEADNFLKNLEETKTKFKLKHVALTSSLENVYSVTKEKVKSRLKSTNEDRYYLSVFPKGKAKSILDFFDYPINLFEAIVVVYSSPSAYDTKGKSLDKFLQPKFDTFSILGIEDYLYHTMTKFNFAFWKNTFDVYTKKHSNAYILANSVSYILNEELGNLILNGKYVNENNELWAPLEEDYDGRNAIQFKHIHVQKGIKTSSDEWKLRKLSHILYGDPVFNDKKIAKKFKN
ncbi:hypothetical protein ACW95P_00485 [Candidatus Mycoplasma pogonae]